MDTNDRNIEYIHTYISGIDFQTKISEFRTISEQNFGTKFQTFVIFSKILNFKFKNSNPSPVDHHALSLSLSLFLSLFCRKISSLIYQLLNFSAVMLILLRKYKQVVAAYKNPVPLSSLLDNFFIKHQWQ